jgi:hypothetical protein
MDTGAPCNFSSARSRSPSPVVTRTVSRRLKADTRMTASRKARGSDAVQASLPTHTEQNDLHAAT